MTIASRNQISHYQEAKSNLQSLVKQTCQVGLGFAVMLLVTAGRPSAFGLSVTVGLGIAFVAWGEVRRLDSNNFSINEETQRENTKTYYDHPIDFHLGITKEHKSNWYADSKRYPELLPEDNKIRLYVEKNLGNAGIADIRIERKADQVELGIRTAIPGVVVLQAALGGTRQIRINVIEVSKVDADARLIGEYIAQQLKRLERQFQFSFRQVSLRQVLFRRVVRQAIQRAQLAEVKGIVIQVSDRLNGAEIARTKWVREGQVPFHTLANIDYAYVTAKTIYGILGVKVWIFKGEIIPGQDIQPVVAPAPQPHRQQFEDRSGE